MPRRFRKLYGWKKNKKPTKKEVREDWLKLLILIIVIAIVCKIAVWIFG